MCIELEVLVSKQIGKLKECASKKTNMPTIVNRVAMQIITVPTNPYCTIHRKSCYF